MSTTIIRLLFDLATLLGWVASPIFDCFCWLLGWLPYVLLFGSFPAFVFWKFNPDTANAIVSDLYDVLWTKARRNIMRLLKAVTCFVVNLLRWRCIHMFTCTCFEGRISNDEHDEALADLREQLREANKDLKDRKSNIRLLNFSSRRWRQRAEAAEEQVTICQKDHVDLIGLNRANRSFRARVDDLEREDADLRIKYNLERRNKGRHPLFDDLPSNLEERNRDLQQKNTFLQEDLRTAREALAKRPFTNEEREGSEWVIARLNQTITRQEKKIDQLEAEKEGLERLSRMTDEKAKKALRDRNFDLQEKLRISIAQQNAIRAQHEAEAIITAAGGGTDDPDDGTLPPGIPNCARCEVLRIGKRAAEEKEREKTAEVEALQKTHDDDQKTMNAFLERLDETRREIARLKQVAPTTRGSSESDAVKELTHIYDRLKEGMIKTKKAEPEQTVNLNTLLEMIDLIPDLFQFQEDTLAGFEAHQAKLLAAYQQIEMFEELVQDYNNAVHEGRKILHPGKARDPDYDIRDFVHHAVAAITALNQKIEQQMLFNRSTPNEQQQQLEALQAENIGLKVGIRDSKHVYDKAVKEADRLRAVFQTQAIDSRKPEDKRRHAIYNNLEAVFREIYELMDTYKMSHSEFTLPNWIQDLYVLEHRDPQKLPSPRETEDLAQNLRQVICWMQDENWPGSKPDWHDSIVEGFPPSVDDQLGKLLKPLMEKASFAVHALDIHNNEVWMQSQAQKRESASNNFRPEGCTCPPGPPGALQSCPVCVDLRIAGTFSDQMNRSLDARGHDRKVDVPRDTHHRSCSPPQRSDRSPFSPPGVPWNTSRPSGPYTKSFGARIDTSSSSKPTDHQQLEDGPFAGAPSPSVPPSRTYAKSFGARSNAASSSKAKDYPPQSVNPSAAAGLLPSPPPSLPDQPTVEVFGSKVPNVETRPSGTNTRPLSSGPSPKDINAAESEDDSPSVPNPDDDLTMDENPAYWRIGLSECQSLFTEIQGLQEGLHAHGIDITQYRWMGEPIEYIDAARVDGLSRRKYSDSSLFDIQTDALQWQRNALEFEVWEKNIAVLGSWEDSPYHPENQSQRRQEDNVYMGEETGWERTNVQQGWLEILALQRNLRDNKVKCGHVSFIDIADIINFSGEFVGRKMTTADVLSKQLDFVISQMVDLQDLWERNVAILGPRSALPFYSGEFASRGIAGGRTSQHEWRNDPQCIKLWDWVIGIQKRFREREVQDWKELKTWQVDACRGKEGERLLASQAGFLTKHIQRLENVWVKNGNVLGEKFAFRKRNS